MHFFNKGTIICTNIFLLYNMKKARLGKSNMHVGKCRRKDLHNYLQKLKCSPYYLPRNFLYVLLLYISYI